MTRRLYYLDCNFARHIFRFSTWLPRLPSEMCIHLQHLYLYLLVTLLTASSLSLQSKMKAGEYASTRASCIVHCLPLSLPLSRNIFI